MFKWLKKRSTEPTSYMGLAMLITSIGTIFKADYVPEIGGLIAQSAEPLASGDYTTAATIGLGGLLGLFMAEKGKK